MSALSAPPTAYWQCERWSRYADALVRYYARRSDFSVRLSTGVPTACVIPGRKQVIINPVWRRVPLEHLARVQVAGHERLKLTLEGLAAHEAAHIRFSGPWPGGLLGQLVNSLEDERIERLQRQDFDLARAFTFLGDHTLVSAERDDDFYSARAGVLMWRFQHDFPHDVWHTGDPRWAGVKPLVEAAWDAPGTDAVVRIARQIMAVLGLAEDAPEERLFAEAGVDDAGEVAPEPGGDPGGNDPGRGASSPPDAPADDSDAFDALAERLELARPLSRQLERILRPPQPRNLEPSRSRGRLNARRVVRREERPFENKVARDRRPRRIVVLQDVSGSMGHFTREHAHYHALSTSLALELACARLAVAFTLIGFGDRATHERPFGMPRNEALLAIAALTTRGGTKLREALELVADEARADDLIFVLCDGQLDEEDATRSRGVAARTAGTFVPILIGERSEPGQFRTVFGRCFRAAQAAEVPAVVARALRAARAVQAD